MSLWILDTDHVSLFQNGHPKVTQRLNSVTREEIAVTIITFEEQIRGRFNVIKQANSLDKLVTAYTRLQITQNFFNNFNLLGFNQDAASCYAQLKCQKIRIGTQDLKIAAITIANNAILLTRNQWDFERVPGLQFDDWT